MKLRLLLIFILTMFFYNLCFAHSWMAPELEALKNNTNPISTESVKQGKTLFAELCASCHGIDAVGLSKEKTGLSKDSPNLPKRLNTHTDGDFHWKILNGKGDMPSFQEELSENETWNIVNYIRSLINE